MTRTRIFEGIRNALIGAGAVVILFGSMIYVHTQAYNEEVAAEREAIQRRACTPVDAEGHPLRATVRNTPDWKPTHTYCYYEGDKR